MRDSVEKLRCVLQLALEKEERVNTLKKERYWYPLAKATYGVEEILEILDSLVGFQTTMGPKVNEFERRFAEEVMHADGCGTPEVVMVNSGSSADLLLALLRLDRDSEVLIPAVTWPTHVWAAQMAGARVRFVDVDPMTLNVSLADLERKIEPATTHFWPVHLLGNPVDDRAIGFSESQSVRVIEDCCEALGARTTHGRVPVGMENGGGAFSFFFSHHVTTMEGGAVVVGGSKSADELRQLRSHGWTRARADWSPAVISPGVDPRYTFSTMGLNVRPTELQAAMGLRQLDRLPAFTQARAAAAERFQAWIANEPSLRFPLFGGQPSWMALPVMLTSEATYARQELTAYLEAHGVETRPIVAGNLLRHPVAAGRLGVYCKGDFPGADEVHERGFYVGLTGLTTLEEIDRLTATFGAFLKHRV